MSTLSVAELTFGDVLGENKSKPWWEKFRGYFFASGVFSSFSMLSLTVTADISVRCLPGGQNKSEMGNFSSVQAAAINAYCAHQVPWIVTYVGAIEFVVSLIVLAISSWWLSHPAVVDSFNTLAKVNEIISSLNLTFSTLQRVMVKPLAEDASEDHKKIRKAAMLIWDYNSSSNVKEIYLWRCFWLILTLFCTFVGSIVLTFPLFLSPAKFDCKVDENDRFAFLPDLSSYECISEKSWNLIRLFSLSFCVSQFGQLGFVCLGRWKISGMENLTSSSKRAERNAMFVINFWKSANPSESGLLKKFFEQVFLPGLVYDMSKHLKMAILEDDIDFLTQYSKMGYIDLIALLSDIVEKPVADYGKAEKRLLRMILSLTKKVDSFRRLLESLAKKKRWRLLIAALDKCIFPKIPHGKTDYRLQWLKKYVNLDEIAPVHLQAPLDEEAGSLLYYAISSEFDGDIHGYQAAKCLLGTMNDLRVKYVHFRGNSMTVKRFISIHCSKEHKDEVLRYADVPEPVTNGQGTRNEPQMESASQAEIALLYAELKDVGNNPPEGYLDGLTNRVYRYKFSSWDGSPTEFAKYSLKQSLWKVFVTLLNAYIVTEEERNERNTGELPCGVTNFKVKHIENTFPIALRTQPLGFQQGFFVPTAARHIISCCTSDQRKLCLKHIHDPRCKLSEEDRTGLMQFISKCNERGTGRELDFDMHSSSRSGDRGCISKEKAAYIPIPKIVRSLTTMEEHMRQKLIPQPSMLFSDGLNEGDSTDSPSTSSSSQNPQPREARGGARPETVDSTLSRKRTDSTRKKLEDSGRLEQKQPSEGLQKLGDTFKVGGYDSRKKLKEKKLMGELKSTEQKAEVLDHEKTETERRKDDEERLLPKADDSPPKELKEKKPTKGSKTRKVKTAERVHEVIEMEDMKNEKQSLLQPKSSSHPK